MSFNGSGTFNLYAIGNPVVTGTTVSSSWANNTLSDIASGLSNCITRDGQSPATANIPMGSHKITGLAVATTTGDALSYGNVATVSDLTASGTVTISGGTANGVAYLNGSKVLTTGSALTFDGTNLSTTGSATLIGSVSGYSGGELRLGSTTADVQSAVSTQATGTPQILFDHRGASNTGQFAWRNGTAGASELMRLTSTGLGIGTSSPSQKLNVYGNFAGDGASNHSYYGQVAGTTYTQLLTTSSATTLKTIAANPLILGTNDTERMRIDSSGNLGLGVTPSAWASGWKGIEQPAGSIVSNNTVGIYMPQNAYYNGTNWIYKTTSTASSYVQAGSYHAWNIAPSGTAGSAISFTQAMTLDASGNLGVGVTSITAIGSSRILEVGATTGNSGFLVFNVNGTRTGAVYSNASETSIGSISSLPLLFKTGDTERARIDSSGNLLVGTTTSPVNTRSGNVYQKLGTVSTEGSSGFIAVSTTPVKLTAGNFCGMAVVMGYNTSGGAQQSWIVLWTSIASATVVSTNGNCGLTVTFTVSGNALYAQTSSGTLNVEIIAFTGV